MEVIEDILRYVKTKIPRSTDVSFFNPMPTSIAHIIGLCELIVLSC